jgi:hypothetical protein
MPSAGILAAASAAAGIVAPPKALYIDGVNVLNEPVVTGSWGVPIDSIELTENGPGMVSSLTFSIDDPTLEVVFGDTAQVLYYDLTLDVPLFLGWVESSSPHNAWGGLGRTWEVSCVGVEAVLDWAITTIDLPFAAGSTLLDAVQSLAINATGTGPLRTTAPGGSSMSTQANPVSSQASLALLTAAITVPAGTSLREAIRMVTAVSYGQIFQGGPGVNYVVTVDFYYGLRFFPLVEGQQSWSDGNVIQINTAGGGANLRPADLEYRTEGATVRGVYVKGAAAAAFPVTGSSSMGPMAYIEDTSLTTAAACLSAGNAYLAQFTSTLRGTVRIEAITPGNYLAAAPGLQFHPGGSSMNLTEAATGLAGDARTAYSITKRFYGNGLEDWTIAFGGAPPSMVRLMRRYTTNSRVL